MPSFIQAIASCGDACILAITPLTHLLYAYVIGLVQLYFTNFLLCTVKDLLFSKSTIYIVIIEKKFFFIICILTNLIFSFHLYSVNCNYHNQPSQLHNWCTVLYRCEYDLLATPCTGGILCQSTPAGRKKKRVTVLLQLYFKCNVEKLTHF